MRPVPTCLRAGAEADGDSLRVAPDSRRTTGAAIGRLVAAFPHLAPEASALHDPPRPASRRDSAAASVSARITDAFSQPTDGFARMHFRPVFSFSIRRFCYDRLSRRLLVDYFDGRQSICADVPPLVVAVLQGSSTPETVLLRYTRAKGCPQAPK